MPLPARLRLLPDCPRRPSVHTAPLPPAGPSVHTARLPSPVRRRIPLNCPRRLNGAYSARLPPPPVGAYRLTAARPFVGEYRLTAARPFVGEYRLTAPPRPVGNIARLPPPACWRLLPDCPRRPSVLTAPLPHPGPSAPPGRLCIFRTTAPAGRRRIPRPVGAYHPTVPAGPSAPIARMPPPARLCFLSECPPAVLSVHTARIPPAVLSVHTARVPPPAQRCIIRPLPTAPALSKIQNYEHPKPLHV